jgi:hypothetical protein
MRLLEGIISRNKKPPKAQGAGAAAGSIGEAVVFLRRNEIVRPVLVAAGYAKVPVVVIEEKGDLVRVYAIPAKDGEKEGAHTTGKRKLEDGVVGGVEDGGEGRAVKRKKA